VDLAAIADAGLNAVRTSVPLQQEPVGFDLQQTIKKRHEVAFLTSK
jgi:hypothetical protein